MADALDTTTAPPAASATDSLAEHGYGHRPRWIILPEALISPFPPAGPKPEPKSAAPR